MGLVSIRSPTQVFANNRRKGQQITRENWKVENILGELWLYN